MAENQNQLAVQNAPTKATLVSSFKKVFENKFYQEQIKNSMRENAGTFSTSLMELVSSDTKLLQCDPNALMAEAVKAASMKLPLNKQLGLAYLVPFKNKGVLTPTLVIGYKGYKQLAYRTGEYVNLNNGTVFKGEMVGINKLTGFIDLSGERESDGIVGYFAYFELRSGLKKCLYMSLHELAMYALKNAPTFKYMQKKPSVDFLCEMAQKHYQEGGGDNVGWYGDFNAMAEKTVLRRLLSKDGLLSIEMAHALAEPGEEQPWATAEEIRNEDNNETKQVINAENLLNNADEAQVVSEPEQPKQEEAPI